MRPVILMKFRSSTTTQRGLTTLRVLPSFHSGCPGRFMNPTLLYRLLRRCHCQRIIGLPIPSAIASSATPGSGFTSAPGVCGWFLPFPIGAIGNYRAGTCGTLRHTFATMLFSLSFSGFKLAVSLTPEEEDSTPL